jgi:hypothetical protein
LNRRLLFLARRENYRLIKKGRGCRSNIYYEASNQPAVDDAIRAGREWKRPDFTCGLVDAQAGVDRFMAIEGKRLGEPPSPSWVLNENYINNGIWRFIDDEWAYGKDTASGIMIGYIQTMAFTGILKEVNGCGKTKRVPALRPSRARRIGSIVRMQHSFPRCFPLTPFRLVHIWVHIRRTPAQAIDVA